MFSCNKKKTIHISAINPVTGEKLAGLRFTITEEKTGAQEIFTKVYDSHLNENGEALFDFEVKKRRSYKLNIETPENNCYKEPANKTFAFYDESFEFKFELAPCANLKLKINNINCLDENDSMLLYREHSIKNHYTSNGWLHSGCVNWETNGYSDLPMGNVFYRWEVTRNSNTEIFYDTIYLEAGEYRTYEINY